MGLATVKSRSLRGTHAPQVLVEVHMANGLPQFSLVGLADTEVKESRERVRSALLNSGFEFPHNQRITCNLAPADLPKDSGRLDLPIALGILAASGQIPAECLDACEFAGELSLAGELRPVRGALAMALAISQQPDARTLILPRCNAQEASLVQGLPVLGASTLLELVAALRSGPDLRQALPQPPIDAPEPAPANWGDLADVRGHSGAKRALEIAAAGGHSLLMAGPPGSGKSMLAQRFAGLLPALTREQALESAALLSLAGLFDPRRFGQRVTRTPHHHTSASALVGGGSTPRPGEISLAHHGVLFLDELPEFPRPALESLREPMETGCITISRARQQAHFPARFQLIAAMNPCPCGHLGSPTRACRCTPDQVARYRARLSGPLLDRIDMHLEVRPLPSHELLHSAPQEPSRHVLERVQKAQARASLRQGKLNNLLDASSVEAACVLGKTETEFVHRAARQLGWSARGIHRALKLARTIADVEGSDTVRSPHLAEAMQYRRDLMPAPA
ncbi:MAG: hypothetical protein RL758_2079 [Pseudomonadota bacterium]|jgi:magnesium chelatase family protein